MSVRSRFLGFRTVLLICACAALLLAGLVSTPAAKAAGVLTDATGPVHSGLSGKCLDDYGNSSANGATVDLYDCNGSPAQNWTVKAASSSLQINGLCLAVTGGGTSNGTLVHLETCNGGGNQQWGLGGSVHELVNLASGRCLDDPGFNTTNGTRLQIYD